MIRTILRVLAWAVAVAAAIDPGLRTSGSAPLAVDLRAADGTLLPSDSPVGKQLEQSFSGPLAINTAAEPRALVVEGAAIRPFAIPNRLPVSFIVWLLSAVQLGSFVCQWALTRTALPQVSWFVAGTSQLVSNAVSKTVPGGAAMGAATGYRMLSVSGVNRGTAGAALAGTAIVSNGVLFALPMVAVIGSSNSAVACARRPPSRASRVHKCTPSP